MWRAIQTPTGMALAGAAAATGLYSYLYGRGAAPPAQIPPGGARMIDQRLNPEAYRAAAAEEERAWRMANPNPDPVRRVAEERWNREHGAPAGHVPTYAELHGPAERVRLAGEAHRRATSLFGWGGGGGAGRRKKTRIRRQRRRKRTRRRRPRRKHTHKN